MCYSSDLTEPKCHTTTLIAYLAAELRSTFEIESSKPCFISQSFLTRNTLSPQANICGMISHERSPPPRHYILGCLFQKLILHSHNRIFKLRKLLKARNTFSHKIKPKKLKNKSYFGRRSHKKCDCQYCSAKWVLHNQDIWKYSKLLNVFIIYLEYHGNLTNKQNMIITTYKQLLGTCIKSKTATYIYSMCQIILQKFSKVTN